MEFINTTGPVATHNTGLHCSLLYDCIVLSCYLLLFVLFAVNFVMFLFPGYDAPLNLNLNLNCKTPGHTTLPHHGRPS